MSRDTGREVRKERAVRRERIATAVLAGMYANPVNERMVNEAGPYSMARWSVEAADALLSHLTAAESRDSLRDHERSSRDESEVAA